MQVLKPEIRQRILAAAERSFFESGFEGTSTRGIAGEAGISVSNLYKYFEDKHAIFAAVIDPFYRFTRTDLGDLFTKGHEGSDPDAGEITMNRIMSMMTKDRQKFVILVDRSRGTAYSHVKDEIVKMISDHISECIRRDKYSDDYIFRVIAANFIEGILAVAGNYRDEKEIRGCIDTLVRYHMKGIEQFMEREEDEKE